MSIKVKAKSCWDIDETDLLEAVQDTVAELVDTDIEWRMVEVLGPDGEVEDDGSVLVEKLKSGGCLNEVNGVLYLKTERYDAWLLEEIEKARQAVWVSV